MIDLVEAVTKYAVGDLGIKEIRLLFMKITWLCVPCPDITSNHPWSIDFIKWCEDTSGAFIMNCDDRGVRYHIVHDAQ